MSCDKWIHQEEAVSCFIKREHGILEMATGTGKTRTAIRIIQELFEKDLVNQVLIIMYGNDLLEQWYREILLGYQEALPFRWYGNHYEFPRFQMSESREKIILVSRDAERVKLVLEKLKNYSNKTLVVLDEVHGAGSETFRQAVGQLLVLYRYRLGLSATPIREFDDIGNVFLEEAIGPAIFKFGLKDAIKKGILCGFNYIPLHYELTLEEKRKKRNIIAAYENKRRTGITFQEEEMYRDLARVNKLGANKIPLFREYVEKNSNILKRCIIFVETREYGLELQKMLISYVYNFHTYYGNDDSNNLKKFADGQIQCLITCKKISEGIDIKSVENIILFSSDRGRLVTTQRIGRSLRKDSFNKKKIANIIDFVLLSDVQDNKEITADQERELWLTELSRVREE